MIVAGNGNDSLRVIDAGGESAGGNRRPACTATCRKSRERAAGTWPSVPEVTWHDAITNSITDCRRPTADGAPRRRLWLYSVCSCVCACVFFFFFLFLVVVVVFLLSSWSSLFVQLFFLLLLVFLLVVAVVIFVSSFHHCLLLALRLCCCAFLSS